MTTHIYARARQAYECCRRTALNLAEERAESLPPETRKVQVTPDEFCRLLSGRMATHKGPAVECDWIIAVCPDHGRVACRVVREHAVQPPEVVQLLSPMGHHLANPLPGGGGT